MNQDTVRIKGTRHGLVIILDASCDFEDIKANLLRKMESAKGFFKGAKFSLFQGHKDIPPSQKTELENICQKFGMVPHTGAVTGIRPELAPSTPAKPGAAADDAALLVRRSLRSGQKIVSPDHVVILGDVHPGAEVVSGGNILIMGHCRGTVHAGAGGDRRARVVALQLDPLVISIADRRYAPDRNRQIPSGRQVARLAGTEIVFERWAKPEGSVSLALN